VIEDKDNTLIIIDRLSDVAAVICLLQSKMVCEYPRNSETLKDLKKFYTEGLDHILFLEHQAEESSHA
jgi:hypothetical protein